jgi:hypothetical protein
VRHSETASARSVPVPAAPPNLDIGASGRDKRALRPEPHLAVDPFLAGSEGGPGAFAEDVVMGVPPKPLPRWLVPVIAGAAVLVGALVAFLIAR